MGWFLLLFTHLVAYLHVCGSYSVACLFVTGVSGLLCLGGDFGGCCAANIVLVRLGFCQLFVYDLLQAPGPFDSFGVSRI